MNEWKEIALEYKREIQDLLGEMNRACDEFSKGMPKSYKKGLHILENSLDFSEKSVRILNIREPYEKSTFKLPSIVKTKERKTINERDENENSFSWLHSN